MITDQTLQGGAKDVSVVIISLIGGEALDRCKSAIGAAGECIVSKPGTGPIPLRRMRAVRRADRKFVAFIEDTVLPCPYWLSQITAYLECDNIVGCGGPVRIASSLSARSTALALADYGQFIPRRSDNSNLDPSPEKPHFARALPGCNMAFRREELLNVLDEEEGFIDQKIFDLITMDGGKIALAPRMAVTYCEDHARATALTNRFEHGRIYASRRFEHSSLASRAGAALRSLLLPLVLTGRMLRHDASPTILGWALLQNIAWSVGELVGSLSLRRHDITHWS